MPPNLSAAPTYRLRRYALALWLCCWGASAHAAVFTGEREAAWQRWLDAGALNQLEQAAQQRLQAQPEDVEGWLALTLSSLDLADGRQLASAVAALERCVARQPGLARCHYALALGLSAQARVGSKWKLMAQVGRVQGLLQRALELDPQLHEARSALQQLWLAMPAMLGGGVDKARTLQQGVRDAEVLHLMRAREADARKDRDAVERELRAVRATRQAGLLFELRLQWADLGRDWMFDGQLDRARAWYELLLQEHPRQAVGAYGLARVLLAQGQPRQALQWLDKARQMDGAELLALDVRAGECWAALGDTGQARAAYERYLKDRRASARHAEEARKQLAALPR
ncbi:tol-pal system YbgF family protein [Roseateles sp. BYS180W]|uniref:Tol-pal system YbgF family protein n=1 Tax=Roseateles rivi TaxID=3299028 RepID=A0ABW7FUS9_9BURK